MPIVAVFTPGVGWTVDPLVGGAGSGGTLQYANLAAFPATGDGAFLYVALDTNLAYAWTGAAYEELSPGGAGANTYVDVTASRDYAAATDKGRILRPSPASSSFTVTIQTTSGQAAGDVFATSKPDTGTLTVAAGAGVTLNDNDSLQAAQAANDFPLGFLFESTTVASVG